MTAPGKSDAKKCPYRGLQPFSKEDQEYFSGRSREAQIVISALYSSKLTIFYGESGAGKTSVIQAGVLPELLTSKEHRVAALLFRSWQSNDFEKALRTEILTSLLAKINELRGKETQPHTLDFLKGAFCEALKPKDAKEPLTHDELYKIPLDRFMAECCASFSGTLFFIFDQFEEYFSYHPPGSQGSEFDAVFARAVNNPKIPANFMLSLRDDGLGKLDRLRPRIPSLLANMLRLDHLDRKGAEEAIRKPLEKYQERHKIEVTVDDALVAKLLDSPDAQLREDKIGFGETDESPVVTEEKNLRYKAPFLQVVLTRLWEESEAIKPRAMSMGVLTNATANKKPEESESQHIVRTHFDNLMSKLSADEQDLAADVLRFLVRSGGQKIAREPAELEKETRRDEDEVDRLVNIERLVEKLSSEDIGVLRRPSRDRSEYEIRHDVMGLAIRDWCDRRRDYIQKRKRLQLLQTAESRRQQELDAKDIQQKNERKMWSICVGIAFLALLLLFSGAWYLIREKGKMKVQKLQAELDTLRAEEAEKLLKLERDSFTGRQAKDNALNVTAGELLGLAGPQTPPERSMVSLFKAVVECRSKDAFVPPRALAALDLASRRRFSPLEGSGPTLFFDEEKLPLFESPNQSFVAVLVKDGTPRIFDTRWYGFKDPIPKNTERIEAMGLWEKSRSSSDEKPSTVFWVQFESKSIREWERDTSDPGAVWNEPKKSILGKNGGTSWIRSDPGLVSYDRIVDGYLMSAIIAFSVTASESLSADDPLNEVNSAISELHKQRDLQPDLANLRLALKNSSLSGVSAEKRLAEEFYKTAEKIWGDIGGQAFNRVLLSNFFAKIDEASSSERIRQAIFCYNLASKIDPSLRDDKSRKIEEKLEEKYLREWVDDMIAAAEGIQKGIDLWAQGREGEALIAYQNAVAPLPDLQKSFSQQEFEKRCKNVVGPEDRKAGNSYIQAGNTFSALGQKEQAIEAFEKARKLLKLDDKELNAEAEYKKWAPKSDRTPSAAGSVPH